MLSLNLLISLVRIILNSFVGISSTSLLLESGIWELFTFGWVLLPCFFTFLCFCIRYYNLHIWFQVKVLILHIFSVEVFTKVWVGQGCDRLRGIDHLLNTHQICSRHWAWSPAPLRRKLTVVTTITYRQTSYGSTVIAN
jgi:hypothetical protein